MYKPLASNGTPAWHSNGAIDHCFDPEKNNRINDQKLLLTYGCVVETDISESLMVEVEVVLPYSHLLDEGSVLEEMMLKPRRSGAGGVSARRQ